MREYLESELNGWNERYKEALEYQYNTEKDREEYLELLQQKICLYKMIIAKTFSWKKYNWGRPYGN